jgi:hypothetical protein
MWNGRPVRKDKIRARNALTDRTPFPLRTSYQLLGLLAGRCYNSASEHQPGVSVSVPSFHVGGSKPARNCSLFLV